MPLRLEVLAVPFSGHRPGGPRGLDEDGEYFSPHTETALELYGRTPLAWHHGRDPSVGKQMIGHTENWRQTPEGWWCTAVIGDSNPRLTKQLRHLAERGELFASTGSVRHLVQIDGGHIKNWPVAELSLTLRPANHHATARLAHQPFIAPEPDLARRRVLALAGAVLLNQRAQLAFS